jgi:hypothetical protein
MITLQQFMETVDYKITEGGDYGWTCYGPYSHQLSAWNGIHGAGGWSANIVFSTKSQKVYEVEICDYTNERAYRMINPKFKDKHDAESDDRGALGNQAWDDVNYIDLDVEEDMLEKMAAIIAGEHYDTRVQVPVDFSDDELLQYMKLAHERDMTFNQLVEEALRHAITEFDTGRLTKEDVHSFVLESSPAWPFEEESLKTFKKKKKKGN